MKRPLSYYPCVEAGKHVEYCQCHDEPENDSECLRLILAELRSLTSAMGGMSSRIEGISHEQRMQNRYGSNR